MSRKNATTEHIDRIVGIKMYNSRIAAGLSRQQLATRIGVTHQQIQKYEKATNRISAGRLKVIAKALNKEISSFFEEDKCTLVPTFSERICLEVTHNFMKIQRPEQQIAINGLIKVMSANQ